MFCAPVCHCVCPTALLVMLLLTLLFCPGVSVNLHLCQQPSVAQVEVAEVEEDEERREKQAELEEREPEISDGEDMEGDGENSAAPSKGGSVNAATAQPARPEDRWRDLRIRTVSGAVLVGVCVCVCVGGWVGGCICSVGGEWGYRGPSSDERMSVSEWVRGGRGRVCWRECGLWCRCDGAQMWEWKLYAVGACAHTHTHSTPLNHHVPSFRGILLPSHRSICCHYLWRTHLCGGARRFPSVYDVL